MKDKKKGKFKKFIERHYVLTKEDKGYRPNKAREPLKVAADIGAAGLGTAGGLLPNKVGFFLGLGLLITGRLVKDKTGLLGITGSSMIGYSVAMAKESSETEDSEINGLSLAGMKQDVKAKFKRLKENWLHATYLNKVIGDKDQEEEDENSDESVGAIDLSAMDSIARKVEESGVNAEIKRLEQEEENDSLYVDYGEDENLDYIEDFDSENEPVELQQIDGFDDGFDHYAMATM